MNTSIPAKLTIGDLWTWTVTNGDYPASDSWVMSYVLVNATNRIDITSSASADDHVVSFSSAGNSAGRYSYQQYFTLSGNRYTVDKGYVELLPDFASGASYDNRSHVRKTLDALELVIEGVASKQTQSYSIEGRSLSRFSHAELLDARAKYLRLWKEEEQAAARENGQVAGGRVLIKLGGN